MSEKNRCNRIMKEVVSYYLDNDMCDFDLKFSLGDGVFRLEIDTRVDQEPTNFQKFVADLNTERQLEVDEYFNALIGAHCHDHDYTFLGKTIDKAEGKFEDGLLSLVVWRFEEH